MLCIMLDGGHQAIDWDEEARRPRLNTDKCVGCHLCLNVCPVMDCITPGEIVIKPGREEHEIKIKTKYEIRNITLIRRS